MKNKRKILITGASGFLGSSLIRYVKNNNKNFIVYGINAKRKCRGKNFYLCNLNNRRKLLSIITKIKPDVIFHLAGGRFQDDRKTYSSNFEATISLFKAIEMIKNYTPRIIIPGTAAEYGKVNSLTKKIQELYQPKPSSWYGFVKYLQTSLGLLYARKHFDVVIARIFNILGTGTSSTLAIGRFSREISLIEKGTCPKSIKTQNLSGKRDFLDIDDVCSALLKIANKGVSGEIYNVCSGKAHSVRVLLKKLLSKSIVKNIKINEIRDSSQESFDIVGSNDKLKKQIRWKPSVTIEESLKNTLEYYRHMGKK